MQKLLTITVQAQLNRKYVPMNYTHYDMISCGIMGYVDVLSVISGHGSKIHIWVNMSSTRLLVLADDIVHNHSSVRIYV